MRIIISVVSHKHHDVIINLATLKNLVNISQVIIVCRDNSPTRKLKNYCQLNNIIYVPNENLYGYGKNQNLNFNYYLDNLSPKEKDYFLVLNPDIVLSVDSIQKLKSILKDGPEKSIMTANLFLDSEHMVHDDNIRTYPKFIDFIKTFLFKSRTTMINRNGKLPNKNEMWCSGAFILVEKSVFIELGGFNEVFHMYCEDIEFCFRARKQKIYLNYLDKIKGVHFRQRESQKIFSRSFFWHIKSDIEAQIRSIQENVRYNNLISRFIIVDDGSTDNTISIIKKIMEEDSKIEWHKNTSGKRGPIFNFQFGINLTTANYVMLSDQDDYWLDSKIEKNHSAIDNLNQDQRNKPLVIFSDLEVVDKDLNMISDSYFSYKKIPKQWHESLANLVQQNVLSGCCMLINRALIKKALPFPEGIYMHDWWLALVGKHFGQVVFIDSPLILYRQHKKNTIGVRVLSFRSYTIDLIRNIQSFRKSFKLICNQASLFRSLLSGEKELCKRDYETIFLLSNWNSLSVIERLKAFQQNQVKRSNIKSKVLLFLQIFLK